ncbi:hypothetical protein PUN28_001532 [Cardiocondyla obscurior]|uniref:Uncharacterized protein n=1 Tax=Cardiocondyla obscurior TaxID=286306 RepID=A0AAW2H5W6_9HYME
MLEYPRVVFFLEEGEKRYDVGDDGNDGDDDDENDDVYESNQNGKGTALGDAARSVCGFRKCLVHARRILPDISNIPRGGGGLGQASCFGGATLSIIVAVTPPLRIETVYSVGKHSVAEKLRFKSKVNEFRAFVSQI